MSDLDTDDEVVTDLSVERADDADVDPVVRRPARPQEQSTSRKFVGMLPLLAIAAAAIIWSLPGSAIKNSIPDGVWKATQVPALQQNWGMFAPDPPDVTLDVDAVVTFADGSNQAVTVPKGDPFFGSIYSERFRKWEERLYPVGAKEAWPNAAVWFGARAAEATGKEATSVVLRRRWTNSDLPGRPVDRTERVFDFFRMDLKSGAVSYLDPELGALNAAVAGGSGAPAAPAAPAGPTAGGGS